MKKQLLSAALAMGALLAGSQASQPTPVAQTQAVEAAAQATIPFSRPEPAKLLSPANSLGEYIETIVFRPNRELDSSVCFVEKPGRRKVKYGKSRWVIL